MTSEGEEVSRIIVETFADYLRDRKAFLQGCEDQVRIPVRGIVLDPIHVTPRGSDGVHELQPRNDLLVDEGADKCGQERVVRDGHSKR